MRICDGLAAGCEMGGGAVGSNVYPDPMLSTVANQHVLQTLAAVINGWHCESGDDGPLRLCSQYYALLSALWIAVILTWAQTIVLSRYKTYLETKARINLRRGSHMS